MANPEHLEILRQGVEAWNKWRAEHSEVRPDLSGALLSEADLFGADLSKANLSEAMLSGADLSKANLSKAMLSGANLSEANFIGANLIGANLSAAFLFTANLTGADFSGADLRAADLIGADLSEANLIGANLCKATLSGADLSRANLFKATLSGADLSRANLRGADLSGVDLSRATLVEANLQEAEMEGCRVYGASVWGVNLQGAAQRDLIITDVDEPVITVDNLEVAQFMYLLLHNEKIRDVIDTITSKVVLILGRFTPERKAVLDAIRDALRKHNYLPVMFDFDKPASRDFTETITTLARLSRFIIADFTGQRSLPHEIASIVPDLRSIRCLGSA